MKDVNFFKVKNAKDWKTSISGIVGAVLVLLGLIFPNLISTEDQGAIVESVDKVIIGLGVLIPLIVGIFGAKDGDK